MIMTSSPKEEKNSNDCPEEKELHEQIDDNMTSSTNNNHCNEQQVHEEVDGDLHADEKDGDESTGKSNGQDAKSLLSSKIDDLQSTLNQVRRDTESEIARLRDELIEKNRTLEKLQIQLTEQRDYELLKRQCEILKTMAPKSKSPELVTAATNEDFNEKSSTTPDDQTLPSPKGLEMFLLQRAKALQHANPALKALVDIQAAMGNNSWLGEAMKGHFEKSNEKKGTEESEQRLRKSLEHSLLPLPHLPTSLSSCPVIPPSQSPSNHSNNSDTDKDSRSTPSQLAVATTNGSCSKSVSDDDIIKHDTTMRKENPIISLSTSLMNQPTSGLISSTRIPKSDPMEGALQDMLRYNMEKFAGQSLDTIGAARRVRELLSVHNIGQRLFAKYVLGLSQGTVSELLSKPKCWEKLTEKGRDSYRKMHAWAYDENAILLLKSLIPRKDGPTAQDSEAKARFPNYPRFPFPMPLGGDAKKLMDPTVDFPLKPVPKQEDEVSDLTRSKNKIDIENKDPFQRFGLHGLNSFLGKTADDMQRAVEVYQMELARLQQQRSNAAVSSVFGIEDQPDRSPSKSDHDEDTLLAKEVRGLTQKFNPLAGLPCPPTGVPSSIAAPPLSLMMPQLEKKMVSSSPLQGMASITNSLTAQPLPSPYRPPQRSFKAILPPITQEEFDRFDSINTEEIVRKVKEILSQYSISQRLFGESILGLSQGSVSDLLARPKQFHMLTQKGKEPFIRMKLFLEDEQAVHKLVASQYKISPEKLMRTGNYTGSFLPSPTSGMSFNVGKVVQPLSPKLPTSEIAPPPFLLRSTSPSSLIPSSARFPSASEQPFDPLGLHKRLQESTRMSLIASAPRFPGPNSIYEMAALTQELNTYQLTTKVREVLAAHNIGQKLFGETILGLSQGSVSELLTKPKPWHMLSIKGREPFIRMHLWLNDPMNIDKLHSIKEEKDCLKRKRENSIDPISNPSSPKTDPDDGHDSPVGKRYRSHFSDRQREALKVAFALDSYPSQTTIEFLGRELDLEPKDIVNWFHNHRMRLKQVQPHDMESILTSNKVEESFDPLKFRILVNQRWLELCEEQEVPDSPIADANRAASGLDLSHQDLEKDDVGAEDLRRSKDGSRKSEVGSDQEEIEQPVSKSNGRSRRKPLLPQWLHPSAGLEESKLSGHVDINSSESKELVATK